MSQGLGYEDVLHEVINKAESDIILLFVIAAVAMVIFMLPLYGMILRDRKERRVSEAARIKDETDAANTRQDKYMERERQIIAVITANTEAITSLKSIFEISSTSTTSSFARVHDRLDKQAQAAGQMQATLDEVIRKQQAISDDIQRGFSEIRLKAKEGN